MSILFNRISILFSSCFFAFYFFLFSRTPFVFFSYHPSSHHIIFPFLFFPLFFFLNSLLCPLLPLPPFPLHISTFSHYFLSPFLFFYFSSFTSLVLTFLNFPPPLHRSFTQTPHTRNLPSGGKLETSQSNSRSFSPPLLSSSFSSH